MIKDIGIKAFFGLTNLSILHLGENKLVHINQQAFSGLNKVKMLYISNVKVSVLPYVLHDLNNISDLFLDRNQIFSLDRKLFGLKRELQSLFLFKSQIKNIEAEAFLNQQKMVSLRLDKNQLTNISSGMWKGLIRLERLSLESNAIKFIAETPFIHLRSLKKLYLSENQISVIMSSMWRGLVQLRYLDLSQNILRKIKNKGFEFLKNCKVIDLSGNKIVHLEKGALKGLTELLTLDLRNNPIHSLVDGVPDGNFPNRTGLAFYIDIEEKSNDCSFCLCKLKNAPTNRTLILKQSIVQKHRRPRSVSSPKGYDSWYYLDHGYRYCCFGGFTWERLQRECQRSYYECLLTKSDHGFSNCGSELEQLGQKDNYRKDMNDTKALFKGKKKHKLKDKMPKQMKMQRSKKRLIEDDSADKSHKNKTKYQTEKENGPDFVTVGIIAISIIIVMSIGGVTIKTLITRYRLLATVQQNEEYEIQETVSGVSKEDSVNSDSYQLD